MPRTLKDMLSVHPLSNVLHVRVVEIVQGLEVERKDHGTRLIVHRFIKTFGLLVVLVPGLGVFPLNSGW